MFRIYNGRDEFWQWDLNQKLIVDDNTCCEVHFCNSVTGEVPPRPVREEGDVRVVDVPNELLQSNRPITAYVYVKNDGDCHTKKSQVFKVLTRPKPEDYVHTPEEVKTWEDLQNQIGNLDELNTEQKDSLVSAINEAIKTGEADPEYIAKCVEEYLAENPPEIEIPNEVYIGSDEPPEDAVLKIDPNGDSSIIPVLSEATVAEIGQTIVVKSVDENGKPTEWESADLPSGGGWRKIVEMTIDEDTGNIEFDKDIQGNPIKAVKYLILLKSAIPTDEAWTSVRVINVAPWTTKEIQEINNLSIKPTSVYGKALGNIDSKTTNKATSVTAAVAYIEILEGMAYMHMWNAYNNGSLPDALHPTTGINYPWYVNGAKKYLRYPYSVGISFVGALNCFSAGSTLEIWAVDYTGGE